MKVTRFTLLLIVSLALSAITATGQRPRPQNPPTVRPDRVDAQTQTNQMNVAQELRCRGGDLLQFNVTPSRKDPATGEQMMTVTMSFLREGAAGAQSEGLRASHCGWIDRSMDVKEPWRLIWEDVFSAQARALLDGGLKEPDRSPTAAERWPDAQSIPRYLSTADHYWRFWVRINRDHFDVERNGSWKRSKLTRAPNQTVPMNPRSGNLQIPTQSRQDRIDAGNTTKDLAVGTITAETRWRTEYGVLRDNPTSTSTSAPCRAFSYKATMRTSLGNAVVIGPHHVNDSLVTDQPGYYICRYTFNSLPLNQEITLSASVDDFPALGSESWINGSEAQPPPGNHRTLVGGRSVTLTRDESNVTVKFEMTYAPIRSPGIQRQERKPVR